eukprot:Skav219210  [mRNA]  locus=scaffold537:190624:192407:+ [translate_table: standard]
MAAAEGAENREAKAFEANEAAQKIQKVFRKVSESDTGREISVVNLSGDVIFQAPCTADLTVFKLKSQIAAAQKIMSQEDILTYTRVDYDTTAQHAASKIGGAWKRRR